MLINSLVIGVAVATASVVGCSSGSSSSDELDTDNAGTVGLELALPGGLQITTVSYAITGPRAYTGSVDVPSATSLRFVVPQVAPGNGYRITLEAMTTDGNLTCLGTSAAFSVLRRKSTPVTVKISCIPAADAGRLLVNGNPVSCGTWTSAVANPSAPAAGQKVELSASGDGPDPKALTYQWSASAGAIDKPRDANAKLTCPTAGGKVTLTLVVGDGPVPRGFTCPTGSSTTTVTVTCPAPTLRDWGAP